MAHEQRSAPQAQRSTAGRAASLRAVGARNAWLSITPEPERELPVAIAQLRGSDVGAERARVERLVTHGNRRKWNAYIAEAAALAAAAPPGEAREIVLDVVRNHDNLKLGLPGGSA